MRLALTLILGIFTLGEAAIAADFVRLKSGRLIEGAVIRQDTIAVYLAPWDQRALRQPELQVFARDEVESIWLGGKPAKGVRRKYTPRPGLVELGGGLGLQTWASTLHQRRHLIQFSTLVGTSISDYLGMELVGEMTAPFGKSADPGFDSLQFSYQLALHLVGTLKTKSPFTPFAYVGAGIGRDVSTAGVTLTKHADDRNLVEVGIGAKLGFGGVGLRTEIRHAYYEWNKTIYIGSSNGRDYYTTRQSADATSMRVSLFTYF